MAPPTRPLNPTAFAAGLVRAADAIAPASLPSSFPRTHSSARMRKFQTPGIRLSGPRASLFKPLRAATALTCDERLSSSAASQRHCARPYVPALGLPNTCVHATPQFDDVTEIELECQEMRFEQ